MSAPSAFALAPEALMPKTVSSHRAASRSSTPTAMPSRARRRAQLAPIPAAAPVTRATFSAMQSSLLATLSTRRSFAHHRGHERPQHIVGKDGAEVLVDLLDLAV